MSERRQSILDALSGLSLIPALSRGSESCQSVVPEKRQALHFASVNNLRSFAAGYLGCFLTLFPGRALSETPSLSGTYFQGKLGSAS